MIHKAPMQAHGSFTVPGKIISAGLQGDRPFIWYEVGPDSDYALVVTGEDQPEGWTHVATVPGIDGWFVGHIYAAPTEQSRGQG